MLEIFAAINLTIVILFVVNVGATIIAINLLYRGIIIAKRAIAMSTPEGRDADYDAYMARERKKYGLD
ncbi:hypothetical protein ABC502_14610 [Alkalimonas sp. NCh-2]|uniref:hypothetical protein n=1 Tax=Alkalimonas sp. NCh-2 TaxID=3144846 RepID=UPI0031F6A33C